MIFTIYFFYRYNVNFEKERKLREYRHQMQPTWEEDIRLAKLKIYRRDLIYLAENLPYPVSSGISSIFDRKKIQGWTIQISAKF